MKKIYIAFLVSLVLLLSSCRNIDPVALLKANSQVQAFLEQYPNADITMVKMNADQVEADNEFAETICGVELQLVPHYKVKMVDPDSDLEVYAYIELESQEVVCVRKIGKEEAKVAKEKEVVKVEEQKKEEYKKEEQKKEEYKEEEKQEYEKEQKEYEHCDIDIQLDYELLDGNKIMLKWTPYDCEDFEAYKVVWSNSVENPKYPDQGYVEGISGYEKTVAEPKLKSGVNYFAITVLTKGGNVYSNTVKVEYEGQEANCEGYDPVLESSFEGGNPVLEWTPYECDDLSYYKVVWSQTNSDPMYPDDGYISVISDYSNTKMKVPAEKYKEGTNYYRISVILDGFYDGNDDLRLNTNVVTLVKNGTAT
ncbi:hypothetical protein JXC34_01460 [Candidatus Woesearchaeota archaeon]|nr:hypothetical protein [Candidatus Woesearchaeota archaeon]